MVTHPFKIKKEYRYLVVLAVLTISTFAFAQVKPMKSTPELLAKGKTSFTTNCAVCHGEKGDGNGPAGAAMSPKPRNFAKDKFKKGDKPEQVFQSITKGLEGTAMAPFGHLPEDERWGLTYYVLSLKNVAK